MKTKLNHRQGGVKKKITALIPCRNEEEGVGAVIDGFKQVVKTREGYELEIIVVDNNSTDATTRVAREHGAFVIHESNPGKGNAMRTAFENVPSDTDYVVMIDGDNTYQADELFRLIEPLESRFASVVIGSRLTGRIVKGAMSRRNRFGNWVFSFLVRMFYHANITDVLTGYFAWNYHALNRLRPYLTAGDFSIEMDMVTKMARLGENIFCVPISYIARSGESNLKPFRDGLRILFVFLKNYFWSPDVSYVVKVPHLKKRRVFA